MSSEERDTGIAQPAAATPDPAQGQQQQASNGSAETERAASLPVEPSTSQSTSRSLQQPEVKVYKPPSTAGPSTATSLSSGPEDPRPSAAELKTAFARAISGRNGPDAPLMTRAMREREDAKYGRTKKTWDTVRIRIRFSDRTQLESTFPSTSTLSPIYTFVRSSLSSEHVSKRFTLYQTPPKRDLDEKDPKLRGKTVGELGLVPAAVLNVKWEDSVMNGNSYPAPLKADLLATAADLPPPPSFDDPSQSRGQGQTLGRSGSCSGTGAPQAEGQDGKPKKAIPKWFKGIGGKK